MAIVKMGIQDEASEITYNNSISEISATNVQNAIDELSLSFSSITAYASVGNYGSTYTTSNVPLSWTTMSFDITDEETNPDVIEKDSVYPSRINIKENGTYLVGYRVNIDDELQGRIVINDTTFVPGSYAMEGSLTDQTDPQTVISHFIPVTLNAGDYLSFQYKSATTYETILFREDRSANFTVIKIPGGGIRGPQGPVGPAGSGTTLHIKDDDVYVPNTPFSILNFKGDSVSVTDGGSGMANITFSSPTRAYFHAHNNTTTQTLSTSFVTIIIATNIRKDSIYNNVNGQVTINKTGYFKVTYDVGATSTGARSTSESVLEHNGVIVPGSYSYGYHRNVDNGENTVSATVIVSITSGDYIRVRIKEKNGGIVTLANACRLTIEEI